MSGQALVAGLGNIFLGDDGFGSEVARRLAGTPLPDGVRLADYGTSGMHLAYDLASGYETAILIDAARRGGAPGTLTVLEVDPAAGPEQVGGGPLAGSRLFDGHGMQPDVVLGVLGMLGGTAARILVVCCEPASTDYGIGLSEPVAAAVDEAVRIVTGLVTAAHAPATRGHAPVIPGRAPATAGDVPAAPGHAPAIPGHAPARPAQAPATTAPPATAAPADHE